MENASSQTLRDSFSLNAVSTRPSACGTEAPHILAAAHR